MIFSPLIVDTNSKYFIVRLHNDEQFKNEFQLYVFLEHFQMENTPSNTHESVGSIPLGNISDEFPYSVKQISESHLTKMIFENVQFIHSLVE